MLKILHGRILQEPFLVFRVVVLQLLVFLRFHGLDVVQRFLLAVARESKPPQQPRLLQPVPLLNVVQVLAHAQNARHVVVRLVRVNHGQIQAQHGVRAGNTHPPLARLSHVVAVARHRFVNERNRVAIVAFSHRDFVVLRHNLANARVLGHTHTREVVVFQPLLHLGRAGLGVHRQHVIVRDLRKQRLLRLRQVPRVVRNRVPPEKHQVFVYERVAHRAKEAHVFGLLVFFSSSLAVNFIRSGAAALALELFQMLCFVLLRRLKRHRQFVRRAAFRLERVVLVQ